MKIALINENSQAAKNGIIETALKKVVEPMGHRRPHLCARSSPTAAVIPSTSSSLPRPPQAAGARQRIWADLLSSWHPRLLTLSMA